MPRQLKCRHLIDLTTIFNLGARKMTKSKRWDKKKKNKRKNTLQKEVYDKLSQMYLSGSGRSRQQDKKNGSDKNYIYSSKTYLTYKREAKHFITYCKSQHPEILHLKECIPFANDYIQYQIDQGYSAWTISTRKAAISKLLSIPYCNLIATPSRNRENIQRSRASVERDRHISKGKELFFAKITAATGLRRNELQKIRGTDLRKGQNADGTSFYYLHITKGTKGGKERDAPIMGISDIETQEIINLFLNAGNALVCPRVPNAYDNHFYRGIYAKRIYGHHARITIPPEDKYIMRKERYGEVLDKKAMRITSKALGHNRIDVIAQNYLY